jgi:N-acetylmuramoyl-L-alanine amidase
MDRRRFLGAAGLLALTSPALSFAATGIGKARVTGYRMDKDAQAARLVIDVTGEVPYQVFTLSSPSRIVIDLDNVIAHLPVQKIDLDGAPITAIRSGSHGNGLRIVLDAHAALHPQASMRDGVSAGQRQLVVRLSATRALASVDSVSHANRPTIIAIDPGHGGKDPGAISATNHYEKYVALAIADKLHGLLSGDARFQPVMIRDDDHFIPLQDRVLIAHQRKADLFVSIHADAAPVSSAQGASVYVLSQHGASSAMARWLADSENSSDMYASLRDSALYTKDPMLSKVLVDMSMSATIASSLDLGKLMIEDLQQVTQIHQQQVDQAGFAVLKSPDIPSILVETGFMSNADDCRRLITDPHQQALAESLKSGMTNYFRKFPVQGAAV